MYVPSGHYLLSGLGVGVGLTQAGQFTTLARSAAEHGPPAHQKISGSSSGRFDDTFNDSITTRQIPYDQSLIAPHRQNGEDSPTSNLDRKYWQSNTMADVEDDKIGDQAQPDPRQEPLVRPPDPDFDYRRPTRPCTTGESRNKY